MNSGVDFTYTSPQGQRDAFRTSFAGLYIFIKGKPFLVNNLSSTGLGFFNQEKYLYTEEQELVVNLAIGTKIYISNLTLKIARIHEDVGLVGCYFTKLTGRQEQGLDKLILEVQKYRIVQAKEST